MTTRTVSLMAWALMLVCGQSIKGDVATTQEANATETEILTKKLPTGTLRLVSAQWEVSHPALGALQAGIFRIKLYRLKFDGEGVATTAPSTLLFESETIPISELAIWDEPQWLDIQYDGKVAVAVFSQWKLCKAFIYRRQANGQLKWVLSAELGGGNDGAICREAASAAIQLGDDGEVRVKAKYAGGGDATFRFDGDDPETNWVCEPPGTAPKMPRSMPFTHSTAASRPEGD